MFRAENLTVFKNMMSSVFKPGPFFPVTEFLEPKELFVLTISTGVIIVSGLLKMYGVDISEKFREMGTIRKYSICLLSTCIILIFGAYGLDYVPADPIYGGF